jgi:DNA invertase Pin-like site-specific DNA recombinase
VKPPHSTKISKLKVSSREIDVQILGAVAEFERELLRERVKAGMAQARRAGKNIGRPALRRFGSAELERMRLLRMQGVSVRRLPKDFATTQQMIVKLMSPSQLKGEIPA